MAYSFAHRGSCSVADASVALGRIGSFLTAEELADPYKIDPNNQYAVKVDGDFQWETTHKTSSGSSKFQVAKPGGHAGPGAKKAEEPMKSGRKRRLFGNKGAVLPMEADMDGKTKNGEDKPEEKPFELKNLKLQIPKGSFVAIVGRVGTGKVSTIYQNL